MQLKNIETVLFDLDGTLLDTAPDMAYALNQQRHKHGLPELELSFIRPLIGVGSRALLRLAFDIDEKHQEYPRLVDEFFSLYQTHLARSTQLFPEMDRVLSYLEKKKIPWGIVTNRLNRFTHDLLKTLQLDKRAACVVCGDDLPKHKPHPDTILLACNQLRQHPEKCVYIGDNSVDVIASKSAGTKSLVALYGYLQENDDPFSWQADGYLPNPLAILDWV